MTPLQLPAMRVMVTRTDVYERDGLAFIVLSCGHQYEAKPDGRTTLNKLLAVLRRHIGKQQPCYKCEVLA